MNTPYSATQLEAGILNALKAHDMEAVVAFLEVLATVDPKRAELLYQTMRVGIAINREAP